MTDDAVIGPRRSGSNRDARLRWVVNEAPTGRWRSLELGQFWDARDLIVHFARRDLRVRYKQAFLGAAWAAFNPLVGALAFTVLFHQLAEVEVNAPSYFSFALLGSAVWAYFSSVMQGGANSLLNNAELLTKVSFPRIVPPAASLLPPLIELTVGLATSVAITIAVGGGFSLPDFAIGLPLGALLLIVACAGPVLFLSALIVKYRDARALVTFGLQFLLFASPVAYPPELVPERWQEVYYLNPLAGALGLLRSALVRAEPPSWLNVTLSGLSALTILVVGLVRFRRSEPELADLI